jgi:hypothetical protein
MTLSPPVARAFAISRVFIDDVDTSLTRATIGGDYRKREVAQPARGRQAAPIERKLYGRAAAALAPAVIER